MNVRYTILLSSPPATEHLDSVKTAALRLTNNQGSVKIQVKRGGTYFTLITDFTMKNAAQYKVVDEIDKEFKFWIWHFRNYEDSTVSFS
ncbi:hypothetical protein IQ277_30825 [Nostocales cyanobacterium LEGE 12452]|nr:hypothetical protein [Nostocales cyanobacterium LEGE 12452]